MPAADDGPCARYAGAGPAATRSGTRRRLIELLANQLLDEAAHPYRMPLSTNQLPKSLRADAGHEMVTGPALQRRVIRG
jgi:hypothetical protein